MVKFRFQDLKIWQSAIKIANELFDIADDLEKKKLFRFADQLRGSGMSMSNNIAEGSGSISKKDFSNYLNIARRSTFENANTIILLEMRSLISKDKLRKLLKDLDVLCRQITNFQKSLKKSNT
ncbi:MAG: four helix bundle protein [Desulfobacterales bacterium]|nr:MAG: four helix bundle protein [Desulfobacterales bacterium]